MCLESVLWCSAGRVVSVMARLMSIIMLYCCWWLCCLGVVDSLACLWLVVVLLVCTFVGMLKRDVMCVCVRRVPLFGLRGVAGSGSIGVVKMPESKAVFLSVILYSL